MPGYSTSANGETLITISLTPTQAAALGRDAGRIIEAVDTVLKAIASNRTNGVPDPMERPTFKDGSAGWAWQEWVITDTAYLLEKLAGVQAAAIRAHKADQGTYGNLARILGVSRGTAQSRRDAITKRPPSLAEAWATTPPPPVAHTRFGQPVHQDSDGLWRYDDDPDRTAPLADIVTDDPDGITPGAPDMATYQAAAATILASATAEGRAVGTAADILNDLLTGRTIGTTAADTATD